MFCCTAAWDSLCTPMTNFTELYPTIGCIWPLVYFTDQLLAKQLTAAPHNKSLSSGILLWDLWASSWTFFPFVSNLHTRFWKHCSVAKQCSIMAGFSQWTSIYRFMITFQSDFNALLLSLSTYIGLWSTHALQKSYPLTFSSVNALLDEPSTIDIKH